MIYNELKQHGTENFPVEFYHIDKKHPKYEMAYHWHSEVEIVRILCGSLKMSLDNKEYDLHSGDCVFINSETVHGALPLDCVYECIVFNPQYLSINENDGKGFIDGIINHTVYINEIFFSDNFHYMSILNPLFEAIKNRFPGYTLTVTGRLYELLGLIKASGNYSENLSINSTRHNEKNVIMLKKALAYIRANYDTQISLCDIAQAAGISPKYLCTFFKDMTGKTPFEYLNVYRIERAARKLINSDLPVTQIAFSCGFNDLSYFIKTFKKVKNVTPKNFRKKMEQ